MRIGIVLENLDPRRGGVEQWTHQFVQGLLARNHEVHVVAAGFGGPGEPNGYVRHHLPAQRSRLALGEAAAAVLKRLSLDVVHDMGIGWHCDIFQPHGGSRQAAFEQNLLLGPAWLRPCKRLAARWLPRYREFEALTTRQYRPNGRIVLALSEMVQRDLRRFHNVPDEQIRLVYNGVDVERFSPAHRVVHREVIRRQLQLDGEVLFLIVAHNLRLKGVPALLKALPLVVSAGHAVHLAVAGGRRVGPFRRLARRLGVERSVTFLGPVDDAVPFYAATDVYVQPTFYDPCSLVVLEALASGLPVITSQFNGAGELMTPGVHGYLLNDPADFVTLAAQMSQLLDPQRRERMGQAARELALAHSFDDNIDRITAVYWEVAESKQRSRRQSFAA